MIAFSTKGDFSKLTNWFEKAKSVFNVSKLDKYGIRGVEALQNATPKDTGTTANSWRYEIVNNNGVATIEFHNDNIQNNVSVAILIQYGHGTRNGGYVQGIDYINPALEPIFAEIARDAWEEVKKA